MQGEVKNISEISDPTFAGKMMGDGFMVLPENGDVVAVVAWFSFKFVDDDDCSNVSFWSLLEPS